MRLRISFFVALTIAISFSCARRPQVTATTLSHQYLANAPSDSAVAAALSPYKEKHDMEMSEVLVYCEEALVKEQPEGNLGNFVSDCVLERAKQYFTGSGVKADMVLLNNGGLRVSLPQGEITKGKIFELMPFDNELVMIELSGKKFYEMLAFIAEKGGMPVAGMRMEITAKKKPASVTVNAAPLDTNAVYHVITSDYLGEGGDNMSFFRDAEKKTYMKLLIRDVLIEYCRELKQQNKTIFVKKDGRISFSK